MYVAASSDVVWILDMPSIHSQVWTTCPHYHYVHDKQMKSCKAIAYNDRSWYTYMYIYVQAFIWIWRREEGMLYIIHVACLCCYFSQFLFACVHIWCKVDNTQSTLLCVCNLCWLWSLHNLILWTHISIQFYIPYSAYISRVFNFENFVNFESFAKIFTMKFQKTAICEN